MQYRHPPEQDTGRAASGSCLVGELAALLCSAAAGVSAAVAATGSNPVPSRGESGELPTTTAVDILPGVRHQVSSSSLPRGPLSFARIAETLSWPADYLAGRDGHEGTRAQRWHRSLFAGIRILRAVAIIPGVSAILRKRRSDCEPPRQTRQLDHMAGFASFPCKSATSRDIALLRLGVEGRCGQSGCVHHSRRACHITILLGRFSYWRHSSYAIPLASNAPGRADIVGAGRYPLLL
jgi:hypothetical protein